MIKIEKVFISVRDKQSVADLAIFLTKKGATLYGTTGTCKALEKLGAEMTDVSTLPSSGTDLLNGRLKTIHPLLHAAIMADVDNAQDMEQLENAGIGPIDMVIVDNIIPVKEKPQGSKAKDTKISDEEKGHGASFLVRTAVRNCKRVAVVTNPEKYAGLITFLKKNDCSFPIDNLNEMAIEAMETLTDLDISQHGNLSRKEDQDKLAPETLFLKYSKQMPLRYGENPHQKAAFFYDTQATGVSLRDLELVKGSTLSYNNACDLNSALSIALEFNRETVVIVKHGNPTGVAHDKDVYKAYCKARNVDKVATFGATVVLNTQLDKKTARELLKPMVEVIAAPKFTEGALHFLRHEKKAAIMRVLKINVDKWVKRVGALDVRSVMGGVVLQETDDVLVSDSGHIKVTTKRKPTRRQLADLVMAWKVCKHVRSNAIVVVKDLATLGVGAGQMKRLDSLKIALEKAGEEAVGAALASDAYFPFRNVIDEAAKFGVSSIIEPGGARRDEEIISACDEHNVSLCMTGMRHFKH